ncbi:MAG: hypothetical protein HY541_03780 [Deltaproteobacteria bacterium]|nr:hypothetical protein [Deltaproteobacteria bacterium]
MANPPIDPRVTTEQQMMWSLVQSLEGRPNAGTPDMAHIREVAHADYSVPAADWFQIVDSAGHSYKSEVPGETRQANFTGMQNALVTQAATRLEGMGYTVTGVTVSHGYEFHLTCNGTPVTATLYPAAGRAGDTSSQDFMTTLEHTATVLQSPQAGGIKRADVESQTSSVLFFMADNQQIGLDKSYISTTAFGNANRVFTSLGRYEYSDPKNLSTPQFTGSVYIDVNGETEVSYFSPAQGDMPHVNLGNTRNQSVESARAEYRRLVTEQLRESYPPEDLTAEER